jgi:hypothetical protein
MKISVFKYKLFSPLLNVILFYSCGDRDLSNKLYVLALKKKI